MKRERKAKNPLPRLSADAERLLSPEARYALRMRRFGRFYLSLVICMGSVSALAIVVAVLANVLVGLCAAIAVAVLYCYFKKDALRRHLRLSCTSADDGLCIASLSANGEDVLYVPDRLMGLPVRALSPLSAAGNECVTTLYLPDTLRTSLPEEAFVGLDALTEIRFAGSAEAWVALGASIPEGIAVMLDEAYPDVKTLAIVPVDGEVSA